MDMYVGEENLGQVGFTDGIFVVRSDSKNLIRPSIPSTVMLKNISPISNLQTLQVFDVTSFSSWATSSPKSRSRHIPLSHFEYQSSIALAGIGQGLAGMGSMLFEQQQQERLLRNQRAIADSNNLALAERQRLMFERNLQLAGINSTSSRAGIFSNVPSTARSMSYVGDHESGALPPTDVPSSSYASVDNYRSPLEFSGPLNQGLGVDPKFARMLRGKGASEAPDASPKAATYNAVPPPDGLYPNVVPAVVSGARDIPASGLKRPRPVKPESSATEVPVRTEFYRPEDTDEDQSEVPSPPPEKAARQQ